MGDCLAKIEHTLSQWNSVGIRVHDPVDDAR